ncbi:MAG: D-cysteine desulfhydrase [Deltaproteobacteria bacterium]|nr:D-cysteine desulfhydrase [Deltaproteobacteria bacterium]MBW2153957.1 D-cysteine desulfhydrase [Deltaproteobacteria bacterium]
MNLAKFARRRYTAGYTPIEKLSRLSSRLEGPDIFIKRDDLLGLAGGGNKTRKLEFVVAEALNQGADTLITCGAVQSNHCRLTLAAAVKEGLKCRLVLEERVPGSYNPEASGNNFLFKLLDVESIRVVPGGSDMMAEMQSEKKIVDATGGNAYIIPGGASTSLGALGYVTCAEEILSQAFKVGINFHHVICASGSGGTHAGLVTGFYGNSSSISVTGINVSRTKPVQEDLVYKLVEETSALVGVKGKIPKDTVTCFDDYVGAGYSIPTPEMAEAVQMAAQLEGILLDPVYTGKTMAGLIDLVRKGYFKAGENVLFVHTGGSPALYAYIPDIIG